MNNFGFKSYNSWDKLTKVMVGNVFPKGFFEDYQDKKVADVMTKINEETREDLDYFCKVLTESYGVEVHRMPDTCVTKFKRYESVTEFVEEEGYIPKPFNTPRDDQIIFGEKLITGKTDNVFKRWNKKSVDTYSIFKENEFAPWADCDDYIDLVCNEMLNTLVEHDLVDAVDVFCEDIGFSYAQTQRVFDAAKKLGLAIKCHAEQLSNQQGASLVAQYNGLSADHLEYLDETGVKAMANAGTVAVLLPGAFYFLKETKYPPIELLNKYKVPIAIASDFNPGTSPLCSLQLMMNMACTLFNFTPEQALTGVTAHAARALGFTDRGVLKVGARADIAHWQIDHPAQLSYQFGVNKLLNLWILGKLS